MLFMGIAFVILLALMILCFVLALLGFLEIGVIIDDHYVFASKEKRKKMDKKPYYRQSGILFFCLGLLFLMYLLRLLTGIGYFAYIAVGVWSVALVYVIISHYAIRRNQKNGN